MGLKCQITYRSGQPIVYDQDGQISQLYLDALNLTGDYSEALNLWATSQLEDFKKLVSSKNPNLDDVIRFYDSIQSDGNILNPGETFQIKKFMQNNGISSLSDLYSILQRIFKPEGILSLDTVAAINSGLYSKEELKVIDISKMSNILSKVEGQLTKGDIFVEPYTQDFLYKNSEYMTLLGTYEKVQAEELDKELNKLIKDFSNREELYSKIQELPYVDFVERFFSDTDFAESTIKRLQGLRKIPILSYVNGKLTDQNVSHFITLRNTYLRESDTIALESTYDYLQGIDPYVWQQNLSDVQQVIMEIEEQAADINIDIVGLNRKVADRQSVMSVLQGMMRMIASPTEQNMFMFSNSLSSLIGYPLESSIVDFIPVEYDKLNIVKVDSSLTDDQLFGSEGLIPIGGGYYHKVQIPVNKSEMYEFLYTELQSGDFKLPSGFVSDFDVNDALNKPRVLEAISKFIMTREIGFDSIFQEDISLNQVVFKHLPLRGIDIRYELPMLLDIRTDVSYLEGPFISDFYSYILSEKLENSEIYRYILSKFQVNDRDISLIEKVENIEGIQYRQELEDYIRLKKDTSMKYLVPVSNSPVVDDLLYLNSPESVPELKDNFILDGESVFTAKSDAKFIKVQGNIYRKLLETDNVTMYGKIKAPVNPVYYSNNLDFSYDKEVARNMMEKHKNAFYKKSLNFDEFKSQIEKSNILDEIIKSNPEYAPFLENDRLEAFKADVNDVISGKSMIPESIKASKNITLETDKVTVSFSPGTKIDTPAKAFSVNERIYKKVKENTKEKLGQFFQDRFVQKYKKYDSFSVEVNIPSEVFQRMIQQEVMNEVEIMEVENNLLDTVRGELERGVDTEILEEVGYDLDLIITNDVFEDSENIVKTIAAFDSKIELLNLYDAEQGSEILRKINRC